MPEPVRFIGHSHGSYNHGVYLDDTIVAIATAPGRGGIGVVRFSGTQAKSIATPMLELAHPLAAGHVRFGILIDVETKQRLDEVVVTFFAAPHSYTTEDVVEISAHGAPVILRRIVEMAIAAGARMAGPGEFTMRAFLHGRIDLTQAEAVRDLIEAQTLFQANAAAQQLGGALSRRIQPVKKTLVELIATLEAGIDFAEDDISVLPSGQILSRIADVKAPLEALAETFSYGKIVHEGITLAIVGRPNVGKSSLFNRLLAQERAIVTASPGTTRDLVSESIALGGIPLHLVDTAGIRPALDEAERIGIQKSYEALADADIVLVVTTADANATDRQLDEKMFGSIKGRHLIVVNNKCDLEKQSGLPSGGVPGAISTSALTGEGIEPLRQEILRRIGGETTIESGFLNNLRQKNLVQESLLALKKAEAAVQDRIPHEMLLLDLYAALRPLDDLTGETSADDILRLIFSTFCIGK